MTDSKETTQHLLQQAAGGLLTETHLAKVLEMFIPILLLVLTPGLTEPVRRTQIYLNSYFDCHPREGWYDVNMTSVFSITIDVRLHEEDFQRCQLVFRTAGITQRLCVREQKLTIGTMDVNLQLYDGLITQDSNPNKTLNFERHLWPADWCSSGHYLTVVLKQTGPRPDLKKVDLDLWLYLMQSDHREFAMDTMPACGSTFVLDRSRIKVTNVDPRQEVKIDLHPKCRLTFEYDGPAVPRSLCVRFEPDQEANPGCDRVDYKLKLFSLDTTSATANGQNTCVGVWSCRTERSAIWCGATSRIALLIHRNEPLLSEDSVVFTATVWDEDWIPAAECN